MGEATVYIHIVQLHLDILKFRYMVKYDYSHEQCYTM